MQDQQTIILGYITGVYGVKGWVKVHSYTRPITNILQYSPWLLDGPCAKETVHVNQGQQHGKGLIAHWPGCDNRGQAAHYRGASIHIATTQLPAATDDEIYWHQLEGLSVFTDEPDGKTILLGKVSHLLATGANDVLAVCPCPGSIDQRERLIPWLMGQVILTVAPQAGMIQIDWDPTF